MRVSSIALAALSLATGTSAASATVKGLTTYLTQSKLSGFASALQGLESSSSYVRTLSNSLASGSPVTLLVPSNNAWNAVSPVYRRNPTWTAQSLAYHTIIGTVDLTTIPALPLGAHFTTLLNTPPAVHLIGGQSQNIVLAKNGSSVQVVGQNTQTVLLSSTTYNNVNIITVSGVLDAPPSFLGAIALPTYSWTNNTSTFVNYVTPEFPSIVAATPSVTVFVPINIAILNALTYVDLAPQLANVVGPYLTDTQLNDLLLNHVINGTVAFTGGPVTTYTSAVGEPISFGTNGTSSVVYYAGEIVANVVLANIVIENGVIHLIDNMLNNFNTNPTAASSYIAAIEATAKPSV